MRATGFNHVGIVAVDLDASVDFYVSVFGMERIPTYTFAFPTQYLQLGAFQLHIFQRPTAAPEFHHIAIDVDDFHEAYRRLSSLGVLDTEAFFSPIYELPDGSVQLYARDPAGNLVEVDWPDATTLDRNIVGAIPKLADSVPQTEDGLRASLYHLRR
jgi:YD repeat-containing protein